MQKYMITYVGGEQPATPEKGKQHFAKYKAWLAALGDAAVSPANPLKHTSTVHPDGSVTEGGITSMSGFRWTLRWSTHAPVRFWISAGHWRYQRWSICLCDRQRGAVVSL